MANNSKEAKIKFTAETGEFNKAINKAEDELKVLRSELKLNETQMKNTGTSVEGLEKSHKILKEQLEAAQDKTEGLRGKLDKAVEIYGEGSSVVANYKRAVANAQIEEEKITRQIAECSAQLEEQKAATEDTRTATEKLTDKINAQEAELTQLKAEYSDLVIEGKETSDEAENLTRQIQVLSNELGENRTKLENATAAANDYDTTLQKAESEVEEFKGATDRLTDKMEAQQTELTQLKKRYSDLVVEGRQTSDEAKTLAREMYAREGI